MLKDIFCQAYFCVLVVFVMSYLSEQRADKICCTTSFDVANSLQECNFRKLKCMNGFLITKKGKCRHLSYLYNNKALKLTIIKTICKQNAFRKLCSIPHDV